MKEDFVELIQYLDEKFGAVDKKFVKIDERFIEVHQKFQHIEDKLAFKADKTDFHQLLGSVDAYATKADKFFQELVMYSEQ